ncbi:GvpL/GvpF family gas vesicle protein [Streptomyces sp. NPDC088752]|uniref:GvpL/GvpF family gas vesicle protein n=2 Tax=unclassified Streptomyces TaxID=2593676 RepID=UPI00342DA1AD
MNDEPLLYVYAVVRTADAQGPPTDPPPDVTLGGGLATVEHRGLTAVVEPVPAADFAEAPLRERLEDPAWLAVVARAHHAVLDATSRRTTTVPLRLATVRRGESGVRRFLEEGESGLSEALGRATDTREPEDEAYAYADETPATRPPASPPTGIRKDEERRIVELPEKGFVPAGLGYTKSMSASEKSNENRPRGDGSGTPADGTGNSGALTALPAPLAEKTLAAAHAVRGAGGVVWTAVRDRKALTGSTAVGAAAALTGAYALGRRAGRRSRGPLSRLIGGRI